MALISSVATKTIVTLTDTLIDCRWYLYRSIELNERLRSRSVGMTMIKASLQITSQQNSLENSAPLYPIDVF